MARLYRQDPCRMEFSTEQVAAVLHRLFIADEQASLRREDHQKVHELVALLHEVKRAMGAKPRGTLVDLCAGKSALGLVAAALVFPRDENGQSSWRLIVVERAADRAAAARTAVARAAPGLLAGVDIEIVEQDVAAADLPASSRTSAVVVVALHACGPASDAVIERCVNAPPSTLLLVPCCYGAHPLSAGTQHSIPGQRAAHAFVDLLPRHGLVGRRFAQAVIDAERTTRLEEGGFAVDVVEFVAATITPHNLLWRCRRVDEPPRRTRSSALRARLLGAAAPRPEEDAAQPSKGDV
jgi:hypothetical protein